MNLPSLDLVSLRSAYQAGKLTPSDLVRELDTLISNEATSSKIWISRLPLESLLGYTEKLESRDIATLPLFGIPFAIKDNIDLVGLSTTAACPDSAYEPTSNAFVVQQLIDAGAIPIGKTNLDQFATGLVGVRTPYGTPPNAFDPDYLPGGSSCGSAIALAKGHVSFSLGTDTAGSGRIPASFNNLVGHKPTRGTLSCSGVIPACKTLDCVSIFALNSTDAQIVFESAAEFDDADAYARPFEDDEFGGLPTDFIFGVPSEKDLEFFGNENAKKLYFEAISKLESIGGQPVEIDFSPFLEAARLLYEGPWVSERFVAIEEILKSRPEILHPVTRKIIEGGGAPAAADAFKSQYRLQELKRLADRVWDDVDLVVTPTAGTIYTIAEVEADPITLNSNLGYYTNFMNLLDYAATAVPAGFMDNGLPFGVTLFAPAFDDLELLKLANAFEEGEPLSDEIEVEEQIKIAVCGAHMKGLPLNHQLTSRGGQFVSEALTSSHYEFFLLPETPGFPDRPGLVRSSGTGHAIGLEIWSLSPEAFGDFVAQIPHPLGVGKIELSDGNQVSGFICEPYAVEGGKNISEFGNWRAFQNLEE